MRKTNRLTHLGYVLARGILSVVLLVAVASKATLLEAPGDVPSSVALRALTIIELLIEWSIAAWLMSGVAEAWSRRAAMSLLLLFVAVTAWRQAAGDSDCHCFGAFRVPPLVTLSFDLITLCALYGLGRAAGRRGRRVVRDAERSNPQPVRPLPVSFAVMISIVLPMSVVVTERRLWGFEAAFTHAIPLAPQSWLGSQLPLLEEMGSRDRSNLMKGDRILILFSHDCDTCRRYLAQRAAASRSDANVIDSIRLIDIAPDAHGGGFSTPFQQVHLNRSVILLDKVPLEVTLKDGIVQAIRHPD